MEEALIEEERERELEQTAREKRERLERQQGENIGGTPEESPIPTTEEAPRLSPDEVVVLTEAFSLMTSPTACAKEREGMRELEEEREQRLELIDEATKSSRGIAMLNSRIT